MCLCVLQATSIYPYRTFENLALNSFGEHQLGDKTAGGLIRFHLNRTNRPLGAKNYELSNHLGNVLATVSDRKLWSGSTRIADVKSASDYYPFGMAMADRTMQSEGYRYGFNNQEKDDEFYGKGNTLSFKYRVHDARLGRFLSVDPLSPEYPWNSCYAFAENRVIDGIDLEGLEHANATNYDSDATCEDDVCEPSNNNSNSNIGSGIKSTSGVPNYGVKKTTLPNDPTKTGFVKQVKNSMPAAMHILGESGYENSPYMSLSMNYPEGAIEFPGERFFIDLDKAQKLGAEFISEEQLAQHVDEFVTQNPQFETRLKQQWKDAQLRPTSMEREALFKGNIHPSAVDNKFMRSLRYGGKGLQIFGIATTVIDIRKATVKSYRTSSFRPLLAEGIRQGGAWGGAQLGSRAGLVLGIETGPGAIVTGIGGGLFGGVIGYGIADEIADKIDEN